MGHGIKLNEYFPFPHPIHVSGIIILLCLFSDKPSVSIERHTSSDLEDGRGSLTLTCLSQSNPPGRTLWYKKGDTSSSAQYKDQLVFDPISKQQAGDYVCQVLSMYLSCSGYTEVTNSCLDRVVCEYANESNNVSEEERDVISIVLYNIMANEYVSDGFKDRLRVAARSGRNNGQCHMFECSSLNELGSNGL